jgi:hypothetical protein
MASPEPSGMTGLLTAQIDQQIIRLFTEKIGSMHDEIDFLYN